MCEGFVLYVLDIIFFLSSRLEGSGVVAGLVVLFLFRLAPFFLLFGGVGSAFAWLVVVEGGLVVRGR